MVGLVASPFHKNLLLKGREGTLRAPCASFARRAKDAIIAQSGEWANHSSQKEVAPCRASSEKEYSTDVSMRQLLFL